MTSSNVAPCLRGRYIRFNVNLLPGPQSDPVTGEHSFIDIERYVAQAKLAEASGFDSVFLADALAISPNPQLFNWALDPVTILSALARETTHIGLIATISTTYTSPYLLARTVMSIDHISKGRAGWNLVTTMDSAASKNFGLETPPERADRYRRADEFAKVVIALWRSWPAELSQPWDVRNPSHRPINHHGEFFEVAGPLQLPASRQGLPVIYQAGGSDEGLEVAAKHADGVFVVALDASSSASYRTRLNARAAELRAGWGPEPNSAPRVQVVPGLGVSVGSTQAEVEALLERAEGAIDAARVRQFAVRYGLDPDTLDPDAPLDPNQLTVPDGQALGPHMSVGFARGGIDLAASQPISLRRFLVLGGGAHRRLFGTPEGIADDLIGWVERGAADGFNVSGVDLRPFVEHVVPALRKRGVYRREYTGKTLRDNITQHVG